MSGIDSDSTTAETRPGADADSDAADSDDPRVDAGGTDASAAADDSLELAAQVELLADENRRLREEYVRARTSQYRSTAIGLAAIGLLAALAGLLVPDAREVLLALGATGLFGAVLTYYLTPSQFVAADVGERVYTAGATNFEALTDELGLREDRVYVPGTTTPARLYVPQQRSDGIPAPDGDLAGDDRAGPILVDGDDRGLLLEATGGELFREFRRALTGDLAATPPALAAQLTDAVVEQFELADSAEADLEPAAGRVTVAIAGSAFGVVDRFDHPIPSFLAVGFAAGLERPVALEVTPGDDRADWLVTCRWETDGDERESGTVESEATDSVRFDEADAVADSETDIEAETEENDR